MTTLTTPPSTGSNVELVRWAFDRVNAHDVASLRPFWTAETVEHFNDVTCRGTDEISAYFEATFAAVPDFRIDPVSVVGDGEDVFVHWRMTGTHTGAPFRGIAPSGRRLDFAGIDHFVIRDGKIVSNTVVFDQLTFARQVGMMPAEGTPGDRAAKAAFAARLKLAKRLRRR
jgi:steroid delta-isomerase-like uncharacterized protein